MARLRFGPWFSKVVSAPLTDNRVLQYPDKSGVLATVSDLPSVLGTAYRPGDIVDFWDAKAAPGTAGNELFSSITGTGAAVGMANPGTLAEVGVASLTSGTTATGRAAVSSNLGSDHLGSGKLVFAAKVNVNTALSTSTERFQVLAGLLTSVSAANQTNGAYFLYDEGGTSTGSTASPNWQLVTANNGVRTFLNSGIAVTLNAWFNLRVEIDDLGSSAQFYINNSLVGTITTNIPTSTARLFGYGVYLQKSVGVTARTFLVDWTYRAKSSALDRGVPGLGLGISQVDTPSPAIAINSSSTIPCNSKIVTLSAAAGTTLSANQIAAGLQGQTITLVLAAGSQQVNIDDAGVISNGADRVRLQLNAVGQYISYIYLGSTWTLLSHGAKRFPNYVRKNTLGAGTTGITIPTAFTFVAVGFSNPQDDFYGQATSATVNTIRAAGMHHFVASVTLVTTSLATPTRFILSLFVNGVEVVKICDRVFSAATDGATGQLNGEAYYDVNSGQTVEIRLTSSVAASYQLYNGADIHNFYMKYAN